jgi:hypothetical protein
MLTRRGFLLMLGAAFGSTTAGLWLPETGVVTVPRRMVLELTGTCSFCGVGPPAVTALAGVITRSARICDQCIDLCLQVYEVEFGAMPLADAPPLRTLRDLGTAERAAVKRAVKDLRHRHTEPAPRAQHSVHFIENERRRPALANDDPRVVAALRRLRRTSYLVATTPQERIGEKLAAAHEEAQKEVAALLGWRWAFRNKGVHADLALWSPQLKLACSFCDAEPPRMRKLVAGREGHICDGCVADAACVLGVQRPA